VESVTCHQDRRGRAAPGVRGDLESLSVRTGRLSFSIFPTVKLGDLESQREGFRFSFFALRDCDYVKLGDRVDRRSPVQEFKNKPDFFCDFSLDCDHSFSRSSIVRLLRSFVRDHDRAAGPYSFFIFFRD
jgi:hypothetical protein